MHDLAMAVKPVKYINLNLIAYIQQHLKTEQNFPLWHFPLEHLKHYSASRYLSSLSSPSPHGWAFAAFPFQFSPDHKAVYMDRFHTS